MKTWVTLAACSTLVIPGAWAEPTFQFSETAGSYAVGVRVVEQYDYSRVYRRATDELGRPFPGERARPVQTLVWYPALRREGLKPLAVRDYVGLWASETHFGRAQLPAKAKEWLSALRSTLDNPMWGLRDAPAASGRFPVIIYAPGFSEMSWENADLCEYLASYGYVVISSPSMGATTREMTYDLAGIDTQARDISFLIGYAQTLADTDRSRVAVVGHSWGGISNLFAAARDNRIGALVSLDGSLRYSPGYVKQSGDVHPEQLTIPLLSFAQRNFSMEDQDRYLTAAERDGPNVLNAWTHGDLIEIHMLSLSHPDFTSMYQRNEEMWWELFHVWPMVQGDYGREDSGIAYGWMARYVLAFLDAYLKHEGTAIAFLKNRPANNGVPRHLMVMNYREAAGTPASFDEFRVEIGRVGFNHAAEIYKRMLKRLPDFKLEEQAVNAWSEELIDDDDLTQAIALLELNVRIHPTSSVAHLRLGDAYLASGNKQGAIDNYKRSLDQDSDAANSTARRKLKELEQP